MRITNNDEFEAALEEAIELLELTAPGQSDNERLQDLLNTIEAYRPTIAAQAPVVAGSSAHAAALVQRAEELKARYDERETPGLEGFPNDGRGIGPTTGV